MKSMKNLFKKCLILSLLPLLFSTLHAQNLIKNGDFAQGLSNWTVKADSSNNTAEALQDAGGKSGKSIRVSDQDEKLGVSVYQRLPSAPGSTYKLTFFSKTTSSQKGTPGYMMLQFLGAKGEWLNNPDSPTASGTLTDEQKKMIKKDVCNFAPPGQPWKEGSITAIAPPGTITVGVQIRAGNTGLGTIDVSDIELLKQ